MQTVYIAKETVGEHALTSTLLYAADKNVVKLFEAAATTGSCRALRPRVLGAARSGDASGR